MTQVARGRARRRTCAKRFGLRRCAPLSHGAELHAVGTPLLPSADPRNTGIAKRFLDCYSCLGEVETRPWPGDGVERLPPRQARTVPTARRRVLSDPGANAVAIGRTWSRRPLRTFRHGRTRLRLAALQQGSPSGNRSGGSASPTTGRKTTALTQERVRKSIDLRSPTRAGCAAPDTDPLERPRRTAESQ